ncbi:MBL fold metallo-hydrolase [Methylocystis bryophila]|uniref:Phosphoribosyl 1,2-cyclic phosphodiesterase n=1 Tax=Methylocystis bryophila TaxID=655015 RepID=A0A1W6MZZ0_9HYPH|nr:MBL fold metallo-hydrolase [Methylocystis bryophila]ARN83151.1 phosphoribosyl 1,2-cyclic phosphodiesterase [Methylocystis bryophila]BDV39481.1 phosphoribosyl 1,2-cyclic phosphodiesterase [Methylocystis bryophila]
MTLEVAILGCGSSGGVPRVGQGWGKCDPHNPKNRRRRCSILVTRRAGAEQTVILVDTSPDLREQLLDAGVKRVDAVLYTHLHADHTHGIDDLRTLVIQNGRRIPAFMDETTRRGLTLRFDYVFATPPGSNYPPMMDARSLAAGTPVTIEGPGGPIVATPFRLEHGDMDSLGFRFEAEGKAFAYTPDMNAIPSESVEFLAGLDLWIIDALRHQRHGTHFSVSQAFDWIGRMQPRRALLTDLATELDYSTLSAACPPATEPAYDGLRLELD